MSGIETDFYQYQPDATFDAIVFDSIFHFEKKDRLKELALLERFSNYLNEQGYLFIFVHKSPKKEGEIHTWLEKKEPFFQLVQKDYIETVYEEKSIDFKTKFQMAFFIVQRPSADKQLGTS